MLFNSLDFLIFFPIVLLVCFIIPKKIRYIWLLICSYYFYMCWNASYALLILFSTVVTYSCGLGIEWCKKQKWKKTKIKKAKKYVVAAGFVLNLGVLAYFKYTNFFIDTFAHIFNLEYERLSIILPIGISYYSFSAARNKRKNNSSFSSASCGDSDSLFC